MRQPKPARRTVRSAPFRLAAAAAAIVLCASASPAAAEIFHVELADGEVFDTRYQPEEASWDSTLVLLLTDTGNWIAVPKAEISAITTETENKGFGQVIDTTTVVLGWAANDAPLPGEESEFSAIERLQQFYQDQQAQQDYTVDQFVEPGEAGRGGGLPAYGASAPPSFTYFGSFGGTTVTPAPAGPAAPGPAPSAPAVPAEGGPSPINP